MADLAYKNQNFVFKSLGVTARYVDDATPEGTWLNLDNAEELAETALGPRLGSSIVNKTGGVVNALPVPVHSIAKLTSLNGNAYRYAGAGPTLWRRSGLTPGPYTAIASSFSGNPWQWQADQPSDVTAFPYIFFADSEVMLKDNGTLAAPQNMGIFQPKFPVRASVQMPDLLDIDNYTTSASDYTYTGISGGSNTTYVNTTLTSPVPPSGIFVPGLYTVSVADPTQIGLFQYLTIDTGLGQEDVLVLEVTPTGFLAFFTHAHAIGAQVTSASLSLSIPASTTATVASTFGSVLAPSWTLEMEDYIGLYLYVSNPLAVTSITIKFDCGDGSFNTDYFYKVIAQGPLQELLNSSSDPTTAATDAILSSALDIYGNDPAGVGQLNTGLDVWTALLFQLSDFAGSGRADFNDPVFNWNNINGYQVTVVTNDNSSATIQLSALLMFGGFGPDTLGGVAYDYLFTFYNNVDGTESNPCIPMTNVNPPNNTNWVYPRRQPVLLTLQWGATPVPHIDPQTTSLRIYRRGGTLGDNYRRIDEVLVMDAFVGQQQYTDVYADYQIENNDFVSFTNDVPVTSALQVPVNTTLSLAVLGGVIRTFTPASMVGISVNQQVDIGTPGTQANNFETVIVISVTGTTFNAYVQNNHAPGENVSATVTYGQPVTIMAQAFGQMWFAGDPNNPNYLYWSNGGNPQYVSSAANVAVSTPDDAITAIVQFKGDLYVSTTKAWWTVAPGSNANASPTIYPTACKHGCIAPLGYVATEQAIFYQAVDGIRAFAGGASEYLTQMQEFIFQGVGTSPIVEANQALLNQTRAAYWNNMIFFSYIGIDGSRHRLTLHSIYKRWRNDDLDVQALLLEVDTNTLIFGDSNGLVRLDRQNQAYDELSNGGVLQQAPIALNIQSPYSDQGMPDVQKNYVDFVIDCNTAGQTLNLTLLFNDGEFSVGLGSVSNTERQRINIPINAGDGQQAYKISLRITGAVNQQVYINQAAVKAIPLAFTRRSFDTYWLRLGTDESKFMKQIFCDYNSTTTIPFNVYYDDSSTPGFSFTLPSTGGIRNVIRIRLPAVSFRMIRFIGTSAADCQIWDTSRMEYKVLPTGKGYAVEQFQP